MKTLKVKIAQPRVNNPFGTENTEFIICADNDGIAYIYDDIEDLEELEYYGLRKIANVEVAHPAIMAGNHSEVRAAIKRAIRDTAIESGVCVYNQAGVLFVN